MEGTQTALPPAARSYPKELMKFFLSQMEISKEAIRVGTLTLIRAVVGADGEQGQEGGCGSDRWVSPMLRPLVISSFVDTGWAKKPMLSVASPFLSLNLTSTVTHLPHS